MLLCVCLGLAAKTDKKPAEARGVTGVVIKTTVDSFVVRVEDTRVITFKITSSTVFYHGSKWVRQARLKRGALVAVQSSADADGNLTADEVEFRDSPPTFKFPAKVEELLPGGVKDDPLLEKARRASGQLFQMLPNFVCQQSTTRSYAGADHQWRQIDKVTAEVLYENGRESYRDVKLNGRLTGHSIMDLSGSRSTGEFGSSLRALFDRPTEALFRFQTDAVLGGYYTAVYEFAVAGDKSDWRISAGSQMIMTPYTGRIWIDRDSGNVLRIEMKAVDIPEPFPFRRVEAEVDYGAAILPSGRYFLPERAENVSCNDPQSCSRNVIEFRNYHKYVGESSISFDMPEKP